MDVNLYAVRMVFLLSGKDGSGKTSYQVQPIDDGVIQAPEFDPGESSYKALIGRDILRLGVLTLARDGHYVFAY